MARRVVSSTTDAITLGLGSLTFVGATSLAAIARLSVDTSAAAQAMVYVGTTLGNTRWWVGTSGPGTNSLNGRVGPTLYSAPTLVCQIADGWCLVAMTKTAGTSTPRFHKYKFSTGVWTHENAGTSGGDATAATGNAYLMNSAGLVDGMNGDLLVGAVWNAALTDAQIENLILGVNSAGLIDKARWGRDVALAGFWALDQLSTADSVLDQVGTSNQTALAGTAVSPTDIFAVPAAIAQPPEIFQPGRGTLGVPRYPLKQIFITYLSGNTYTKSGYAKENA